MTALYVMLIILAVVLLVLRIPVDCVIDFSYNREENRGAIIIRYLFFKVRIFPSEKKEKAEEKEETEAEENKERDIKALIKLVKTVYTELRGDIFSLIEHLFKKTLRIKELNISAKYGTGNPMYTGITTGMVNAFVYNAVSFIDRNMKLDKWNVSLDSDFDNLYIAAGVYCKIRTNCLYVIKLGIMALIVLLKVLKINRRIKKNG